MTVLFCNIAWMKEYAGRKLSDPPLGGGGFPRTEGYCGEECNFVPCDDGFVYGHFETIKGSVDRQVRIERLGASKTDEFVDGITLVWTAPTEGNDPRTVIGWFRNARVYRHRQQFGDHYPSKQHKKDEIGSYRVKARLSDVVLLPPSQRKMDLQRGLGWSGQASWWYAEDTTNRDARRFVREVKKLVNGATYSEVPKRKGGANKSAKRAGAATSSAYVRYIKEHEIKVSPKHDPLQKKFESYLRKRFPSVQFLEPFRDDLRFDVPGRMSVMVEVKPTEPATLRYAIRTAIGQLLDYRQHQVWEDRQLILVSDVVSSADDLALALENGFGLAWPDKKVGFKIIWPRVNRT